MPQRFTSLTRVALLSMLALLAVACGRPSLVPETHQLATAPPVTPPADAPVVLIEAHPDNPGRAIPSDFLGLGYDAPLLPGEYFDEENTQFINLLKNLGEGVLCFGANGLEHTYWPRDAFSRFRFRFRNAHAVLSPGDVDRMFAFARKAGWRVIFGLNLGANDPGMAADLAEYANRSGGNQILAFEVGNEPDLYYRNGLRSSSYSYADYHREYAAYVRAIRERVPGAPVAGPVTASRFAWFSNFLADEASNIVLATNHHYPLNADTDLDPTDPKYASIENLLSVETTTQTADLARQYANASQAANIPLRFDETNSSYPAKDGVGDVFASSLWSVDYLFNLAERGVSGANFFGGFRRHSYTPIYMEEGFPGFSQRFYPQPLYYGMLLFHIAAKGRVVPVDVNTDLNVTAHAALGEDGQLRIVIVNKDFNQTIDCRITSADSYTEATAMRLAAESLLAEEGITLGGSPVNEDGTWFPREEEPVASNGSAFQVVVPAASAVLVTLR